MQLEAKLIELLPIQTIEGKNGTIKKQEVIVETKGQYPKKVCIAIWNDKIDADMLQVGFELLIDLDIESRSYNGRWYTDVKAWRVSVLMGRETPQTEGIITNLTEIDDLPF